MQNLPADSIRANQALFCANQMMNAFELHNRESWANALQIGKQFLSAKNGDSQHQIHAIGHCHIDTAWLWSYAETKRKCARFVSFFAPF
jgi:alpha-mannosidase